VESSGGINKDNNIPPQAQSTPISSNKKMELNFFLIPAGH